MTRIYITKLSINPEHEYNQIPMYVFVHVKQSFSMRNAAPINIRYPCEFLSTIRGNFSVIPE